MKNKAGGHGTTRTKLTVDGNEAAGFVAHRVSEVDAIYPVRRERVVVSTKCAAT